MKRVASTIRFLVLGDFLILKLKLALETIGERVEIAKALDHEKKQKEIIIIHHGKFNIILNPVNSTYVSLIMKIQITPEDGAKLAKQNPEFHNEFGFILKCIYFGT